MGKKGTQFSQKTREHPFSKIKKYIVVKVEAISPYQRTISQNQRTILPKIRKPNSPDQRTTIMPRVEPENHISKTREKKLTMAKMEQILSILHGFVA